MSVSTTTFERVVTTCKVYELSRYSRERLLMNDLSGQVMGVVKGAITISQAKWFIGKLCHYVENISAAVAQRCRLWLSNT